MEDIFMETKQNNKLGAIKNLFNSRKSELSLDEFRTVSDTTSEDLAQAKEEIIEGFINFLNLKQQNKLDFSNLTEESLAILRATDLDLGLPTKSSEFYTIKVLTRDNIFVVYNNISDFEFVRGSSQVKLNNGRSSRLAWDQVPKVEFNLLDININKAILNLSKLTLLRGTNEQQEQILLEIEEEIIHSIKNTLGKTSSASLEDEEYIESELV